MFTIDFASKTAKTAHLTEPTETHCDSNNCPIWTQNVPSEALFNGLQILISFYFDSKYFVYWELQASEYSFITYVLSKVDVFFL